MSDADQDLGYDHPVDYDPAVDPAYEEASTEQLLQSDAVLDQQPLAADTAAEFENKDMQVAVPRGVIPHVLFISRFAASTTAEEIKSMMEQFGPVRDMVHKTTVAFIEYEKAEHAYAAKHALHRTAGLGCDSLVVDFKKSNTGVKNFESETAFMETPPSRTGDDRRHDRGDRRGGDRFERPRHEERPRREERPFRDDRRDYRDYRDDRNGDRDRRDRPMMGGPPPVDDRYRSGPPVRGPPDSVPSNGHMGYPPSNYRSHPDDRRLPPASHIDDRRMPPTVHPDDRRMPPASHPDDRRMPPASHPDDRRMPPVSHPDDRRMPPGPGYPAEPVYRDRNGPPPPMPSGPPGGRRSPYRGRSPARSDAYDDRRPPKRPYDGPSGLPSNDGYRPGPPNSDGYRPSNSDGYRAGPGYGPPPMRGPPSGPPVDSRGPPPEYYPPRGPPQQPRAYDSMPPNKYPEPRRAVEPSSYAAGANRPRDFDDRGRPPAPADLRYPDPSSQSRMQRDYAPPPPPSGRRDGPPGDYSGPPPHRPAYSDRAEYRGPPADDYAQKRQRY